VEIDPPVVLDTSALVAFLLGEKGADVVHAVLHRARISAVNVAETIEVLARKSGISADEAGMLSDARAEAFDDTQAKTTGALLSEHRRDNLSLGDACCLPSAMFLRAEVFTADRTWSALSLPVPVRRIG
jgi:PIN domain nuclease of toxin-antitoxin system